MEYKLQEEVKSLMKRFIDAGFQIYIVGGAVRDLLMGKEVSDWDFTTDAKPEDIIKLFPNGFYDNRFGTVGIPSQIGILEVTTMRKEGEYKDFRRPVEVGWTNRIEEDLSRRDFTINAMALGIEESGKRKAESTKESFTLNASPFTLIDPFNGRNDLQNKIIRAVGDPNKRFREDALRLMRAIRIATQLGFKIEEKTFQAIKENAHLIKEISAERIRDELFKILSSDNAYQGIVLLREVGILQIILPELEKTFGIIQKGPKHARIYDVGEHSLLTLKYTDSNDPITKLAALLHDIGKSKTVKVEPDGNVTFYNHDVVGGKMVLEIANRLKLSKEQREKLYRLVRWHLFTVDERQTDSAIRRFIKNVGVEYVDDMMALRVGDRLGGGTQKAVSWRMEKFKERIHQVLQKPFTVSDLKVNGYDVMKELNIPPGPKVGKVLDTLFQEVLEDPDKNNREYLLQRLKEIKLK